jgi:hypothetical protein
MSHSLSVKPCGSFLRLECGAAIQGDNGESGAGIKRLTPTILGTKHLPVLNTNSLDFRSKVCHFKVQLDVTCSHPSPYLFHS